MHVVFLHGFPLDSRMWDGQRAVLTVPTSAPTLYGLGESVEVWASRVLDTLEDEQLIVVGCSMGGSCALEMARQASDRIAALVLLGTKAAHRPEPELRDGYVAAIREGGIQRVWPEMVSRFFGPAANPKIVQAVEAMALVQRTEDLIFATRAFHGRPDATDVVRNWKKPLVVICGDQDGLVSVEKASAMTHSAPNASLHVLHGCGHFANLERPTEFNAILSELLQSLAIALNR